LPPFGPDPSAAVHAWRMQDPVLAAAIWWLVLLAIFAPLATRHIKRARAT